MDGLRQEAAEEQCPLTPQMVELMKELREICRNPSVKCAYNSAVSQVIPYIDTGDENPWRYSRINDFIEYFEHWFTFLPTPRTGFDRIMSFIWFYKSNNAALNFLNNFKSDKDGSQDLRPEIFNWTVKFIKERGRFMDSEESLPYINDWLNDSNVHLEDFEVPEGGFKSFNDFFTRSLRIQGNPRPIEAPDDDRVITAPADTMINFIISKLTVDRDLDVKSRNLNMRELLKGSKYANCFEGGTAVSFVLTPEVYHHYHSPVSGYIVEGRELSGIYHGMVDGQHWFDNLLSPGGMNRDFSIFEDFHRAYYIIRTKRWGHVGMVAVGLNTISKLTPTVVNRQSTMVKEEDDAVFVKKGDELGYFAYGGSLIMLLFERGHFNSLSVRMGQQIGVLTERG